MAFWQGVASRLDGNGHIIGTPAEDIEELESGINQILNTLPGERVHLPLFGSDLKRLVFEPRDKFLVSALQRATRDALNRWEDRIKVLGVDVIFPSEDEHAVVVVIRYVLKVRVQVVRTLKVRVG